MAVSGEKLDKLLPTEADSEPKWLKPTLQKILATIYCVYQFMLGPLSAECVQTLTKLARITFTYTFLFVVLFHEHTCTNLVWLHVFL